MNYKKKYTKDSLSERAIEVIRRCKPYYVQDLYKIMHVSPNTFKGLGIKAYDLFIDAGMERKPFGKGTVFVSKDTEDPILIKLKQLILSSNKYITGREAAKLLDIHESTFSYKGISIYRINLEMGHSPPDTGMKPYWSDEEKLSYISSLEGRYKDLIIKLCRPIPVEEFAGYEGLTSASIYRKIRPPSEIHLECGIDYLKLPTRDEALSRCSEVILRLQRYVSLDQLAHETGISEFLLQKYLISVLRFNESLGFNGGTSTFEDRSFELLVEIFGVNGVVRQKVFKDLKSDKGRPLPFDFYIEEERLLVEADGTQHWDKNSKFYKDRIVELDAIKTKYCQDNGYNLLRIKYNPRLSLKHIHTLLSGIPLKHSVGQPAAEPVKLQEGSETIRKE